MQITELQDNQGTQTDLKELLSKFLAYLHFIVLGIAVSLSIAFFYLRYAQETYQASNVIKILDNNNSGFKLPSDAMSFFARNRVNLENEIEVIKSSLLIERVVDELNLQNFYYIKGSFKTSEIASQAPFYIKWLESSENTNEIQMTIDLKLTKRGFYIENQKEIKKFGKTYIINGKRYCIFLKNNSKTPFLEADYQIKKLKKESVVQSIKGSVSVLQIGKQSELLKINVTANHPNKASDIANKLAELFNQDGMNDRLMVHRKTIDFVNGRFAFLFRELDSIEGNKASYKKGQTIADFTSDAGALLVAKTETNSELYKIKTQAVLSDILIETLNKTKWNELLPANIGLEQMEVASLTDKFNELVLQQLKMMQSVGQNHPALLDIRATQLELRNNLKASLATYKKVLLAQINQIEQLKNGQSQQYGALPFQEKAIRSIERQQEIKETLYIILLQKREEAAVNLAIVNPSIKMVELATPNYGQISPRNQVVYMIALLLGFGIPLAFIYLYFVLDTKIYTKRDVENVVKQVPVIVEIPNILGNEKMVKNLDRSVLSEAFRMLRTNLNFLIKETHKPQAIFVTSSIKGEGKTFVSMNLAITLSSLGKKVVLLGADLRNPQLHKLVNISKDIKGVSNYLIDQESNLNDLVVNGSKFNLKCDIMFSGTIPPNPAELLSNGRFDKLIVELKKEYDFIIVDTAPVLLVTDTVLLAGLSDAMVYVVRANFTVKNLLNFINEQVFLKKINNVGIVLNNVGEKFTYKYGYGYTYSYKYNYGYGYDYGTNPDKTKIRIKKNKNFFKKVLNWITKK